MPEPTRKQIEEFKEAFKMFDKAGTGSVTTKELGEIMRSLGQDPTEDELIEMVREVDEDGSGSIEVDEFVQMMRNKMMETDFDIELKEAFTVFDKDRDGFLNSTELRTVMESLGQNLSAEELQNMIDLADKDKDGRIGYREFHEIMTKDLDEELSETKEKNANFDDFLKVS